ncbi:MAG: tRNA-dihydrouridine synthase family protein [Elusimicrobia bacterium]|nr:tRNA-dihydrouridine synthase family protein [Candidatus Obscuribacterium magneticum]
MIRIGSKKIDTNIFLAPLSSCTDLTFRLIAREYGAKLCFFEMVDSQSLLYDSPRTNRMLRSCPEDRPIAAQILGFDPNVVMRSIEIILKKAPITFLDINAACPVRKVYKKGIGSHFMIDPIPLYKLVEFITNKITLPITVKMRVGIKKVDIPGSVEFAKNCELAGASALFVHGRSREQGNHGTVDYEAIKAIKESVKIPVFGSGNILNPLLAKKMFDETNCDGILVAKGALGNPVIFQEIEDYLKTGIWVPKTKAKEKITALKKHLLKVREVDGPTPYFRIRNLAKICFWHLRGFEEVSKVRAKIFSSKTEEELMGHIDNIEFEN